MIFISYRRTDAGGHAGRLFSELSHWFDAGILFYDQDGIDIGDNFPQRIVNAIDAATVVLVLIGPEWLAEINRRVDQPGVDFVRREIERALGRRGDGILVLPILLGGAAMPAAHQFHPDLESSLATLCQLDAHVFQGKQADWENQFVRLRQRLAAVPGLPQPRYRTPAGVEQVFHVIEHSLSPHFQDPNHLLARLHEQLNDSGSAAVLARAALFGMGGVGKTQLALKYSLDYRDRYAGVWWFRAESETSLQLDELALCQAVNAPIAEGEAASAALKRWLAGQLTPWLLVYDNAEAVADLRPHLPEGHHHLLITSRNPAWSGLAKAVEVEVWNDEQSASFLAGRLPGAARAECLRLANDLGGLPLALEQAASYLEETGMALADYRALLAGIDTGGLILEEGRAATGYECSVAATLTLAWDKLSPAAARLLSLCAFAAPEPLPERFFREAADVLPEELAKAVRDTLAWNRTVGELRRYALAQRVFISILEQETNKTEENALLLHRLTQVVVRARHAQPERDVLTLQAILKTVCPQDSNLPKNWPRFAALAEHIRQLQRFYNLGWLDAGNFSWLLDRLANYLRMGPALYDASVRVFRQALEIDRQTLGDDHPDTLSSINNLALTLWRQGDLAGACALQKQVMEARRHVQGDEHPDTLTSMDNLAETLCAQGDLAGARALQEPVMEARRRLLGEDHPSTLTSMNNLAKTLAQGDLPSARTLHEQALDACRRVLGDDHPDTLTSMNNLASTLCAQGDFASARTLQEKALENSRRVLGDDHPDTLTSMNNLASTLCAQGDFAGARTLQEKALENSRRVLGDDHPYTLTSMSNLAFTLWNQGDLDGARALQEQVMEANRRVLGDEHPDTLTRMNNLALTLIGQGDLADARALQELVLEARRRRLGEDHPSTLTSMNNLAETLRAQGDLPSARTLHEQVLTALRRVLGEEHPKFLSSMNNLAITFWEMGERNKALALMQAAANGTADVLGPAHPFTIESRQKCEYMQTFIRQADDDQGVPPP